MPLGRLARRGAAALVSQTAAAAGRAGVRRSLPLRLQTTQQLRAYSASGVCAKEVKFTWHVQGEEIEVVAEEGKTLLEVAHENDIELEGACGGELACSTCHVVFEPALFEQLPAKKEEEEDMLDLAWGLTDTSRLGCQIKVTPLLEGAKVTIPEETNNMLGDPPAAK